MSNMTLHEGSTAKGYLNNIHLDIFEFMSFWSDIGMTYLTHIIIKSNEFLKFLYLILDFVFISNINITSIIVWNRYIC